MIESVDQLGRVHRFAEMPKRIVSLVPSITELLVDLGLRQNLVGCTKFCVHPNDLKTNTAIIGGTKNVKRLAVEALSPDLIIASKEENVKEQVEALQERCPVWVSDVVDLKSGAEMNMLLGELFGVQAIAKEINAANARSLAEHTFTNRGTALYFIWKDPFMSVGGDTYISNVMQAVGYNNLCQNEQRYPSLEVEKIRALKPAHILLSSEPFPFKKQHIAELKAICPNTDVRLVDGEFFSWYGSRMGKL
jgi:ABC-type Fe3+-hydroxamate transport system substrate-binding protein